MLLLDTVASLATIAQSVNLFTYQITTGSPPSQQPAILTTTPSVTFNPLQWRRPHTHNPKSSTLASKTFSPTLTPLKNSSTSKLAPCPSLRKPQMYHLPHLSRLAHLNTNIQQVYYPQATPTSPNLSHLPLPPSLLLPTMLRLVSNNATVNSTYRAMAFELSTPTALLQSLHFYFPTHISANLAAGLYPSFSDVSLLVGLPASGIPDQDRNEKECLQYPIRKVFSATGSGAEMYVERIIKEVSFERLRGVIVHVDWKSSAQEVAEQMAPRRRRRTARRTAPRPAPTGMFGGDHGTTFGLGDPGPRYTTFSPDFGDAQTNEDMNHMRSLLGAGEHDGGRAGSERLEQTSTMELVEEPREESQRPGPTFRQFIGASAPPALMETIGGGWSEFLDEIEGGMQTTSLAGGGGE